MITFFHGLLFASIVYASSTATTSNEYARQRVYEMFADTPVLIDIARCESDLRQFNASGTPLRGRVNREDVGLMQINEHYHRDEAENMDMDVEEVDGNLSFALWLYEKEGTAPWNASRKCWEPEG